MKWKEDLFKYFTPQICEALNNVSIQNDLNEIRIRVNKKIQLVYSAGDMLIDYTVNEEECRQLLALLCEHSIYAMTEELKQCFVTLPKGYRVGIVGTHCCENGKIGNLTSANFFNFRISRECRGAAEEAMHYIRENSKLNSTLIISAPGVGKTTLLRDAARILSSGMNGKKVCIADERSEIAGASGGIPCLDIGERCDVMDGCPKAEAIMRMIRTMSPDVIITDEIGTYEDSAAVYNAVRCGVCVVASAHANDLNELKERKELLNLFKTHTFSHILLLYRNKEQILLKKVA